MMKNIKLEILENPPHSKDIMRMTSVIDNQNTRVLFDEETKKFYIVEQFNWANKPIWYVGVLPE